MSTLVLGAASDSSVSETDESQSSDDAEDEGTDEESKFAPNTKLSDVALTPEQQSLVDKSHKQTCDVVGQHFQSIPASTTLEGLTRALQQLAPTFDKLSSLKSERDREVALRTPHLCEVVNLMVSAEAAVQGLVALRAFCVQRGVLTIQCDEKSSNVGLDFAKVKRDYPLLAYVGTKGHAHPRLASLSLWLLFCNLEKTGFMVASGNMASKNLKLETGVFTGKKGALSDVCRKVVAKEAQGFTQTSACSKSVKRALTKSLDVAQPFEEWRAFGVVKKEAVADTSLWL